jgi:hypothetical protein
MNDLESYKLSERHPNSAGIDLGSEELYVAIPPLRQENRMSLSFANSAQEFKNYFYAIHG